MDTTDTNRAPAPRRRSAPKVFDLSTDLDTLLAGVEEDEQRDGLTTASADSYAYQFERWSKWALDRGWDPWTYSPARVFYFIIDQLAPCSASSVKGVLFGVSHYWEQRGHPRISTALHTPGGRLARAIASSQTRPKRGGARSLGAEAWAKVLTLQPPATDPAVAELRAALLTAWHADSRLSALTVGRLTAADVEVTETTATVQFDAETSVTLRAVGGPTCPVVAWTLLLDAGWDGFASFGRLAKRIRRIGAAPALGLPDGLSSKQSLRETHTLDDVERLCWLLDLELSRWLRDQTVLTWQLAGGFRPSTFAAMTRSWVCATVSDEHGRSLTVSLAHHKGDGTGRRGDATSLPQMAEHPDMCPVRLAETWWWVMGVGDDDPAFPVGASKSIYIREQHRHATDEGALHTFSAPIKARAEALGMDTAGLASTTGRHSLGTEAVAAGEDLVAIADHLGHSEIRSTSHYVGAAHRRAVPAAMERALAQMTPEDFR